MIRTTVRATGAVTVSDATTTTFGSVPPTVVGSAPQWGDDSDATYAELETVEHPEVSYADSGRATLESVPTSASTSVGIYARIRFASLAAISKPPSLEIQNASGVKLLEATPAGTVHTSPDWIEYPLGEASPGSKQVFLDLMNGLVGGPARVVVYAPYLNVESGVLKRMRIYEVHIVIGDPITEAPPCRLFPREDGLGVGGGRNYPPAKSQQRSNRGVGYY